MGWGLELGTDDATNASLLKQLTKAVAKLLSGSGGGAGELLSIVWRESLRDSRHADEGLLHR